jgi:hypothetical protein
MWAKARSERGALIRLCGDGVMSNERRDQGHFVWKFTPSANRNGPFRPTIALQMARVGVPASPWMWAKATSERGAMIRLCGDGVVSNSITLQDQQLAIVINRTNFSTTTTPSLHQKHPTKSSITLDLHISDAHPLLDTLRLMPQSRSGIILPGDQRNPVTQNKTKYPKPKKYVHSKS